MKPKLSVFMPTFRIEKLPKWYESFKKSFHDSYEIILVGPYKPTIEDEHIKWIQDWGHSVRCQQIAIIQAKGECCHWSCDDVLYVPNMMDKYIDICKEYKDVVNLRYTEGPTLAASITPYYDLSFHAGAIHGHIPKDSKLTSFLIMKTDFYKELGGLDCQFETKAVAERDFAIRLGMAGANIILTPVVTIKCEHLPGRSGDHGPMHDAQIEHDEPLIRIKYFNESCKDKVYIDINNWRNATNRWVRRFGKE